MIGQTVSHYKILEKLGEGGMGVVYKAHDTKLNRDVALKFLPPELTRDPEAKDRFIREARAASALDHPNICNIHEFGETDDGQMFITMAHYEGETLKEKIERGPLSIDETVEITLQIARGLSKAHTSGIVHRDIKPANIMVGNDGIVRILDFGLAKLSGQSILTKAGSTMGTIPYMSPEQAQGEEADHRTDLWSLGVVIFEMLTGQRPFQADHDPAILYSIVNSDAPRLSALRSTIPKNLERIVLRLLQKSPHERYQNLAELQSDLDQARAPAAGALSSRRDFRRIVLTVGGIAVIVGILFFLRTWFDATDSDRTIAVLPFSSITSDSLTRDLCAGLTATLTSKLSRIEQVGAILNVIPASSVRESHISSAEDARVRFGATHAVSGEIQRVDQQVRVTVNLIDATEIHQLGSFVGVYGVSELASIQDWTAERLAGLLKVDLNEREKVALSGGETRNSDAFQFYSRGRVYLANHQQVSNIDIAIQLFRRALEKDSSYGLAYAGLGEAYWRKYMRTGDLRWTGPAHDACSRAMGLVPNLVEALVTLGLIYNGTGEYSLAVAEFQKALRLSGRNVDALIGLGNALESLGENGKADSVYRSAIAAAPGYWSAYNNYGFFLVARGNFESAITQFRNVTELAPDNIIGYNNLGGTLMYRERWEEAKKVFERSLSISPSAAAISNLGTIYFYREHEFAKAAALYEQGTRLNPLQYELWANLGASYLQIPGNRDNAVAAYRKAIALVRKGLNVNPHDGTRLAELANFYAVIGSRDSSLHYLSRAQSLGDINTEMMLAFISVYEQFKMRQESLGWVEKALKQGVSLEILKRSPQFNDLVKDPKYNEIESRKGVP